MKYHIPLLVLLAPLLGCTEAPTAPGTPPGEPVPFVTVLRVQHSGIDAARNEVVRDQAAWARLWNEIHARGAPRPPPPEVDFQRAVLLLVATGGRPNGCFHVEIRSVERGGGRLRVSARETEPGPGCVCTQAQVEPVHVVRVDRAPGSVEFEIRRVTLSC